MKHLKLFESFINETGGTEVDIEKLVSDWIKNRGSNLSKGRWASLKSMAVKYQADTTKMNTKSKNSYESSIKWWSEAIKISEDALKSYLKGISDAAGPQEPKSKEGLMYALITWDNPYRGGDEYAFVMNRDGDEDKDFKARAVRSYERGPKTFRDWVANPRPIKYYRADQKDKFVEDYKKLSGNTPRVDD